MKRCWTFGDGTEWHKAFAYLPLKCLLHEVNPVFIAVPLQQGSVCFSSKQSKFADSEGDDQIFIGWKTKLQSNWLQKLLYLPWQATHLDRSRSDAASAENMAWWKKRGKKKGKEKRREEKQHSDDLSFQHGSQPSKGGIWNSVGIWTSGWGNKGTHQGISAILE